MLSRLSLQARLLLAALLSVLLGLAVAFAGVSTALHGRVTKLLAREQRARAVQVLEAARRAQRSAAERLETWAATEDMGVTLDSDDPKFAEDYLLRSVNGADFAVVALVDAKGMVVTAVRPAAGTHGLPVTALQGQVLDAEVAARREPQGLAVAPHHPLLSHAGVDGTALVARALVRDFTGEVQGSLVGVFSAAPMRRLLAEVAAESQLPVMPLLFDSTRGVVVGSTADVDVDLLERLRSVFAQAVATDAALVTVPGIGGWLMTGTSRPASERPSWAIALLVREDDALEPIVALRRSVALTFLVAFLLVALGGGFALRRVSEPLDRMMASMGLVARGDLSVRLPPEPAEDLNRLVGAFNTMVTEVASARASLARSEGLRKELEIAHTLQASVLPRTLEVAGYDVAARSRPASEVGGDFYDLIPTPGGFWLLVGDVSGHGLNAGLIMLMVQAAAQAAVRAMPDATPAQLFTHVNAVIHENVHNRLASSDYVTLVVVRADEQGHFRGAGSHCPVIIRRAGGATEVVDVLGPWCGVARDVSKTVTEFGFEARAGDALLFFTDGLTEATDASGALFGEDRLVQCFAAQHPSAAAALAAVFAEVDATMLKQEDDMTAVVLRRGER